MAAAIAAPNAFPPDEICNYTVGPAESPVPKRGLRCEACWKRSTNYQRCNVKKHHGCKPCADAGLPCIFENWALPPHPDRNATRQKLEYAGWTCCNSCTTHRDCDRSYPCMHCIEKGRPADCDRTAYRGLIYRPTQGMDFYGYWIKLGANRGPMGRSDRDPNGQFSEWLVPDNYHIEYALYKYWKNNWLDHWRGPTPLTWGTPEIPQPQGRIYIGPPPGMIEPAPYHYYRPLHAPSDEKSGYPKGDALQPQGQIAAKDAWAARPQPVQPVPNRPCPLLRGHMYDAGPAGPLAGVGVYQSFGTPNLGGAPPGGPGSVPHGNYGPVDPAGAASAAGAGGGYGSADPAAGYGVAGAAGGYGGYGLAPPVGMPPMNVHGAPGAAGPAGILGPYGAAGPAGGFGAAGAAGAAGALSALDAAGGYVAPGTAGGYGAAGGAGSYGAAGAAGGYGAAGAAGGYGAAGTAGSYGAAGAAGGYGGYGLAPPVGMPPMNAHGTAGAGGASDGGAAAGGLGVYGILPASSGPASGAAGGAGSLPPNPFTGHSFGGGTGGLTTPAAHNSKRPVPSPERERPGIKKPKRGGNNSIREDPVYQLLRYNENNVDVDMMEEDELHHNANNLLAQREESPPHMYGGAEPPRLVYDLEHEGDVLALMNAALPLVSVFSPLKERSPTPLPEMRDAAGNIMTPLSALIASGPPLDPNRMTPFLDMLPRDVPGATGLPLPPLRARVQPQLLTGRAPTTPEEAIVRNEALYRPHEHRMRELWGAQTFNRDVDFRSVASQRFHDTIARALNPRGELIRGTAAPVARPASPGPYIPLFTGPRGDIPQDHPFEQTGGRGAMPNIHRIRAWGEDAVTRNTSAGLCACNQYTHGICESEEHHPGNPHYVCADCDNKSRAALKALFLEVDFVNKIKRYACALCTSGFVRDPACLHGSGQDIYEAAVDEDALAYPAYDPRVMKNNHRPGEAIVIRGGIYPGYKFTGCACAEKLLGRRLCNPHRTQAWIDCLDRMYEMAAYKYTKFEGQDLCWNCLENPPLMPGDPSETDEAGLAWGCIICSGICIGINAADLIVYSNSNNYPLVGDAPPGERVRLLTPQQQNAKDKNGNAAAGGVDRDGDVEMG